MTPEQTFLSIPEAVNRFREAGFSVTAPQVRRWVRKGRFGTGVRRLPNGRAQIPADAVTNIIDGVDRVPA